MYIEVHINGELYHRWHIEDMDNYTIDGATWQENVDARKILAERFKEHFFRFIGPLIPNYAKAEFYLILESKMNTHEQNDQSEMPLGWPDGIHKKQPRADDCPADGRETSGGAS